VTLHLQSRSLVLLTVVTMCQQGLPAQTVPAGVLWTSGMTVGVNSFDFPVTTIGETSSGFDAVADEDLRAMMTGIHASPVGALNTYDASTPGQICTTIHRPDTGCTLRVVAGCARLPQAHCRAHVRMCVRACGRACVLCCIVSDGQTYNYFDPVR
jgi:hypothetical protein